jgi:predicted Zn-dependent peptidase
MITLEKTGTRIEELAKSYMTFNKIVTLTDYIRLIDSVTPAQVRNLVERVLKTKPTLVAIGGHLNQIPSLDKISSRFN